MPQKSAPSVKKTRVARAALPVANLLGKGSFTIYFASDSRALITALEIMGFKNSEGSATLIRLPLTSLM